MEVQHIKTPHNSLQKSLTAQTRPTSAPVPPHTQARGASTWQHGHSHVRTPAGSSSNVQKGVDTQTRTRQRPEILCTPLKESSSASQAPRADPPCAAGISSTARTRPASSRPRRLRCRTGPARLALPSAPGGAPLPAFAPPMALRPGRSSALCWTSARPPQPEPGPAPGPARRARGSKAACCGLPGLLRL